VRGGLTPDLVAPLASVVLAGLDREAHLLGEISADEASDAMVLPVGGLGDRQGKSVLTQPSP